MSSSRPYLTSSDAGDDRADREAATWATRMNEGALSGQEKKELSAWLSGPGNEARLDTYSQLYTQLGSLVPRMVDTGKLADYPPVSQTVRRAIQYWPRFAGALAAAAALVFGVFWWTHRPELFATEVAHRQSIALADGSHVDLNAQTSLAVKLGSSARRVNLNEGEAYFAVAKDPSRPFLVETPAGTVRVTGTHFNVRTVGSGELEVTVLEGSVAVSPSVGPTVQNLHRGDQLVFNGTRAITRHLTDFSAEDVIAWREGRMVFESERLDVAVARFARYHGREIEVSPKVADLEVGGRFKLDELDTFLKDISIALPVQVLRSSEGAIRIVPR